MKKTVRKVAKIVDEAFSNYVRHIHEDLAEDAPQTTPDFSDVEYRWGSTDYERVATDYAENEAGMLDHERYLSVMVELYLERQGLDVEGSDRLENYSSDIVWVDIDSSGGSQMNGQPIIHIGAIPPELKNRMRSRLENEIDSPHTDSIVEFPSEFSRASMELGLNRDKFEEIIAHELTHFHVTMNTDIGELQQQGYSYSDLDEDFDQFMSSLLSDWKSPKEQAKEISTGSDISTLEEIFCYFVSFIYDRENMGVSDELYDDPEVIEWGANIVVERYKIDEPDYPVDWARRKLVAVFNRVARKGRLTSSGDKRDLITLFLYEMLPDSELERIDKLERICEEEISQAYSDLETAVKDIEKAESNGGSSEVLKDFKKFDREVDWNNPRELEDMLMQEALNKAAPNKSIHEVHETVGNLIREEVRTLMKLIDITVDLDKELSQKDEHRELRTAIKEIKKTKEDLEQLQT